MLFEKALLPLREKGWDEGGSPKAKETCGTPHPNPRNL
ncbi:hypothetical protein [Azospirillum doebereinerae]